MSGYAKLHINRFLCCHCSADCGEGTALVIGMNKVADSVTVPRNSLLGCAEEFATRLVGIKHLKAHIGIDLEQANTTRNKINEMVHCFCFFTKLLALFFRLANIGKSDLTQRTILVILGSCVNKIILRGIILEVQVKIHIRRILLANLGHHIFSVLRNKNIE